MKDPFPAEIPQEWIRHAKSDLRMAEIALANPGILFEDTCFHAQQCAEKALKALLTHLKIPFPRTHAIEVLLDLLFASGVEVPPNIDEVFYTYPIRHPDALSWQMGSDRQGRNGKGCIDGWPSIEVG